MSETPRTDRARLDEHDPAVAVASECSKLECELNAANRRIKRLEEAGDAIVKKAERVGVWPMELQMWRKAKEAKL
jgi:hypothetical protein